jgi:beta-propeller repeat-containing protein
MVNRLVRTVFIPVLSGMLVAAGVAIVPHLASRSGTEAVATVRAERLLGELPLYFIENQGQADARVSHYVQGRDTSIYFTEEGLTFALTDRREGSGPSPQELGLPQQSNEIRRWVVKMEFVGAGKEAAPRGLRPTPAVVSYFKGAPEEWWTGIPTYSELSYPGLWEGIDLVFSGTVNRLKYRFVLEPGADPNSIRLAYRGASSVRLNEADQLEVTTPAGGFTDEAPTAYQVVDGRRMPVSVSYALDERTHGYGFDLGPYDRTMPLVLDPAMLVYAGYIGGSGTDRGRGIAVDNVGAAYVTGFTDSTEATFPETVGPDLTYNGSDDAFVAKVNPTGTGLVYAGYVGGSGSDRGFCVAVDALGNAYLAGDTSSTEASFPVAVGPDLTYNGHAADAFVAKVNASGTGLDYAGYIGGADADRGFGVAVDFAGSAYVTGFTASKEATFPETVGPDITQNGSGDAFVAKVNPAGTGFVYAGYIGGSLTEVGNGVAVNAAGSAYVTGFTTTTDGSFPAVGGPDLSHNGSDDAFVAKVNPAGTGLVYAGYIGGSNLDGGLGIAVDAAGSAYVTGSTRSSEATFPDILGPDLTFNGNSDAFVAKVTPTGSSLVYAGYIGGSSFEMAFGGAVAVDAAGSAYVTGDTSSTEATFPVTGGPDLTFNGGSDAFVAKVDSSGSGLIYAGYIGGSGADFGHGIAIDAAGSAYISGDTGSTQATFPATVGPDLTYNGGGIDAFVAKVTEAVVPANLTLDPLADLNPVGTTHTVTGTVEDGLGSPVSGVVVRFTVQGSVSASGSCTTDANGQCSFNYQGPPFPGADAITAFADTNGDGDQDAGEPSGAATKTWMLPVSTPGCEVIITNGGRITAANGDPATFGGNAQVISEGQEVSGQEEYQDHGPADPMNVHSINVLAVVCSADGTEATIFGQATIDGLGSFDYRIRVKDAGEPGTSDQYGILLSTGYFSGDQTLEGGNVQIHVRED